MPEGLNSNLNLNQGAPPRVRPKMGEWGPVDVVPTRKKKRARWWVSILLVVVLAIVVAYGSWVHQQLVAAVSGG